MLGWLLALQQPYFQDLWKLQVASEAVALADALFPWPPLRPSYGVQASDPKCTHAVMEAAAPLSHSPEHLLTFPQVMEKNVKNSKIAVFRGAEAARFVFRGFLDFFFSWTAVLRIELESPLYNLHHFLRWKKLEPEKGWWHYVQVFLTPMSSIHRCSKDM